MDEDRTSEKGLETLIKAFVRTYDFLAMILPYGVQECPSDWVSELD